MHDDYATSGHRELWLAGALPEDKGPEANLAMWKHAETILEGLAKAFEVHGMSEGAYLALVNGHNLCIEERRRAQDLLELCQKWASRGIGGVVEPSE